MSFKVNIPEKKEEKKEWKVEGWIYKIKSSDDILVVFSGDSKENSDFVGYIPVTTLQKLISGDVKGCPIAHPEAN